MVDANSAASQWPSGRLLPGKRGSLPGNAVVLAIYPAMRSTCPTIPATSDMKSGICMHHLGRLQCRLPQRYFQSTGSRQCSISCRGAAGRNVGDSVADQSNAQVSGAAARLAEGSQANSPELDGQYFGQDGPSTSQFRQGFAVSSPADKQPGFSQSIPRPRGRSSLPVNVSKPMVAGGTVVLGVTFLIALFRTLQKAANPKAKRQRTMNKNKFVVESLDDYLPHKRQELTSRLLKGLSFKTGFKPVEIFRKYLWYLLRERKFDHDAVEDVVYLKTALGLTDDQTAAAIKERASRIYAKYGTVMLNTAGMTSAGVEKKATARALFSKLLYLAECEQLLRPGSPAAQKADIRDVFGATEEDVNRLRIVSLYEVDLDKLEGQFDDNED